MKRSFVWFLFAASIVMLSSCQKEHSFESGSDPSSGSLQSEVSGDCLPKNVLGIYEVGTALVSNDNYIEVQVDVTVTGSYSITTNQVNGMRFSANGFFTTTGLITVKLRGSGTPVADGIHNFIVSYDGSQCDIAVTVLPEGGGDPAEFTLNATAGSCVWVSMSGAYTVGVPLGINHGADLSVTVTSPGSYNITTTTVNGITFSGSGSLPIVGAGTIHLTATGTPIAAGTTNIPVSVGTSSCGFEVQVAAAATFTVDCNTAVVNGTYTEGIALDASNTVEVSVNVTAPGGVVLTGSANGMTFTGSATLIAGTHTLTLSGTGTPTADGDFDITLNGTTGSCTFEVPVLPGAAASDLRWKFNVGATVYEGPTTGAINASFGGIDNLAINGENQGGNVSFILNLIKSSAMSTGTYISSGIPPANTSNLMLINTTTATTDFVALSGDASTSLTVVLTTYDTTNDIVSGTFSGTVKNEAGTVVTITGGTFKAELQ